MAGNSWDGIVVGARSAGSPTAMLLARAGPLDRMPLLAGRVRAAAREERFVGTSVTSFFRKPFGPGWALVGEAGYMKDPVTALGVAEFFAPANVEHILAAAQPATRRLMEQGVPRGDV